MLEDVSCVDWCCSSSCRDGVDKVWLLLNCYVSLISLGVGFWGCVTFGLLELVSPPGSSSLSYLLSEMQVFLKSELMGLVSESSRSV
jgi:hypothetical protein